MVVNVFEIGALNEDCSFGGKIGATSYNHITKVGTATLTFTGSHLGILNVAGGVFASGVESAIPNTSITFTGEGYFDPTTNTVDFAAKLVNSTTAPIGLLITNDVAIGEIPASNTAGLTKKGEGTLTLSAAPLYTGTTRIEGGMLVVADTFDASNVELVVDDVAAAAKSGSAFGIAATSLTNVKSISVVTDDDFSGYRIARTSVTIDGTTYQSVKISLKTNPFRVILK